MSPGSMPAALAGESSLGMSLTTTPADLGQADVGRVVEGHVVDRDAERGAVHLAVSISWFITVRARLIGMAKP